MESTAERITGLDLKLLRVSRRITATSLAHRLGVTRSAVTRVEREARPTAATIRRYSDALLELGE